MIQCTFSIAQLHLSVDSRARTSMLRQSAFEPEAEPEPEFVMVAAPLWVDDPRTPWMVNGYNIDRGVDMMPVFFAATVSTGSAAARHRVASQSASRPR